MLAHLPLLFHLSYRGNLLCPVLSHLVIAIFPIHFERAEVLVQLYFGCFFYIVEELTRKQK